MGLVLLLFGPVFINLVDIWSHNEDYSHGFFVVPVSLYILYDRRKILQEIKICQCFYAAPILLFLVMLYLAAYLAKFHTLVYLSFLSILIAGSVLLYGFKFTQKVLPAVLFLMFMFPVPSEYYIRLITHLKLVITKISFYVISFLHLPVYESGNILIMPNIQLEIAEACSGIRSLYSYIMIGCLFAVMTPKLRNKIVMIASAVPLALLINISRVVITALLSAKFGQAAAEGFFHQFSGFMLFGIGFVLMFCEYLMLSSLNKAT